jgi:hypothetical protein
MYRQGDVLLVPIQRTQLPAHPARQDRDARGRLVLANGEVSGHAHVVSSPTAELLADPEEVDRRFLVLAAEALLTHEEHASIQLPAGTYQVVRQREYSPIAHRDVLD